MDAGSNSSGHILAGQCAAGACPSVGCRNGGWYKTCCKYNDYGAGGPSVGDTLTGQISSCANCRYTDCCSGDGGVCVWGTSCTAGAALSSQNFCWHLGSAPSPTSGPTPTPGPTDAPPEGGTGSAMHIKIREDKCSSKNKCVVGETINIKVCQKPKRCFEKSCFYNKINVYTVRQPAGVASGTVLCTAEGFSSKPHCNSCDFLNNDFNTGRTQITLTKRLKHLIEEKARQNNQSLSEYLRRGAWISLLLEERESEELDKLADQAIGSVDLSKHPEWQTPVKLNCHGTSPKPRRLRTSAV